MSKSDMLTWTKHPRGTTRQVVARRYAWTTFWVLVAATVALFAVPNYRLWPAYAVIVIMAIVTGTAARIYLSRTGGKL